MVHEPKNKRVERFDPHARGPTMYLGPNKIRKDAHYFYDPKTRKVLTSDAQEFTEIGSDIYDFWHKGALEDVTEDYLLDPLTEHGCGEGEKLDNQGIKSIPCSRDREKLIVNNVRDLVETQHAENAFSETCWESPGDNEKQINYEDPLLDSPVSRPSGYSGPSLQFNDSLQTPCKDLYKSDEIEEVEKVLLTVCPKGLMNHSEDSEISEKPDSSDFSNKILSTSMIHICDETAMYGLKFERDPTKSEIRNTIRMIKQLKVKYKSRDKKKKKGKIHSDQTDNPNLSQALHSKSADDWITAINEEMKQMQIEHVYEAVTHVPYGKAWVPSHMILIRQRYADGAIKKYKARLVAGGHRQDSTLYDDVSSPTARPASVKILFAKAAIEKNIVRTFDVKGAYLKSQIDEEIYMLLPDTKNNKDKNWVKLHKSIYGFKQAGLLWLQNIKGKLLKFGAQQCKFDKCVFKYIEGDEVIYIVIYVDDILSASSTNAITEKLLKYLREQYGEVDEVTNTATHLGIRWIRLRDGSIKINQPGYIDKILKKMNMEDCDTVQTPIMSTFTRERNNFQQHTIKSQEVMNY